MEKYDPQRYTARHVMYCGGLLFSALAILSFFVFCLCENARFVLSHLFLSVPHPLSQSSCAVQAFLRPNPAAASTGKCEHHVLSSRRCEDFKTQALNRSERGVW